MKESIYKLAPLYNKFNINTWVLPLKAVFKAIEKKKEQTFQKKETSLKGNDVGGW